ncbi:MAG: FAD-dependent oxidoreductase [Proteobacteria bacterium]|nr:FAD-dependent oxidoreductase [Pseudomonadota bacterium]MBI3495955.1 FAD-dependent oxidoreductase [Pseudomonadota bacterium]
MVDKLPSQARVVIIGGGIVGCSLAYHLTKLGWSDVLVLERRRLTSGTTWHAAGLVGQLRSTMNQTRLAKHTADLLPRLEAETGQATGFRRTGSLSLARTKARLEYYRRAMAAAASFGVEMHEIAPAEVKRYWPLMETQDLAGAFFIPGDGQTNPTDTTQALAKGARMGGARIREGVEVTGIHLANGRVRGVATNLGEVAAEFVVNCAGMWARAVGRMAGVSVPLHAAEHMYIVTRPLEGVIRGAPTARDPDGYIYMKEEVGGLVLGGFEPVAKPWGMDGIPPDFEFGLFDEDWDQFHVFMESGLQRIPALAKAEVRQLLVGPESFTPDTRHIVGAAPEVENFFVAAGFNSTGIQTSGGVGWALAEWIVAGKPTMDLSDIDIRRFHPFHSGRRYLRDRTVESVGQLYAMAWPHKQLTTARGVRRSALHDKLAAAGACFGVNDGWERATWFAPAGVEPRYEYSWGRPNWFAHTAAEHRAVREGVGLFDQTSFGKLLLEGKDALAVLQRISAAEMDVAIGKVVYTQWLNEDGGIEADLTVTRLASDRFAVTTSAASTRRDFAWLKRHIGDANAVATDVTSGSVVLGLMGPSSRALLARIANADLADAEFPFATARELEIGYAPALATRITYVGELGWELSIPSEFAQSAFETITEAGTAFSLKLAGYHAMDSLRIEKAYRHWGHDIGPEDTPIEAGMGFAVGWRKRSDFIGRKALEAARGKPIVKRLVGFKLADPDAFAYHDEPIYLDGVRIGRVTSAAFGHTVGASIALGYVHHPGGVDETFLASGHFTIDIAARQVGTTPSLKPFYDPTSSRVRG